jgi:hypothetical protein
MMRGGPLIFVDRGAEEARRFIRALDDLDRGERILCGDYATKHLLSEYKAERERAADMCLDCPAMVACGEMAEAGGMVFGTCGGVDRTKPGYMGRM